MLEKSGEVISMSSACPESIPDNKKANRKALGIFQIFVIRALTLMRFLYETLLLFSFEVREKQIKSKPLYGKRECVVLGLLFYFPQ